MTSFDEEVARTVEYLRKGKVILYPTDTIWGLGCDATNSRAIQKLFKIKKRSENKSLIALIDSDARLKDYVIEVPPIAYDLVRNAAKPISIIYPGAKNLAKNAVGPDGSVCIRITSNDFCQAVVKDFGKAIASTSANVSGEPTPLIFNQISDDIKNGVDYIVQLYQDELKVPKASTIIKLAINGTFEIIRP